MARNLLLSRCESLRIQGQQPRSRPSAPGTTPDVVKRTLVMLQRVAVLVVSVGLVGACEAICQGQRPLSSVVPRTQVSSTNTVAMPKGPVPPLPDAPSASVGNRTEAPAESTFERKWAFKSAATGEAALQSVAPAPPN